MRNLFGIRSVLFSVLLLAMSATAFGQIGFSITIAPPVLPVYEQPICPADGYLWTPGYWGYGDDGYYWVPGDWIQAPEVGFLWTPGYWGWGGNAYAFHEGYWGQTVGFYGGINYGFGYGGNGYEGGRWDNGHFAYNTSVNRVNTTIIHNTYNTRVVETNTRVSFNGGTGGVEARASAQQEAAGRERHIAPVAAQTSHVQEARSNPELRASANHGNPPAAAVAKSESVNEHAATSEKEPAAREPVAKENAAPSNVKSEEKPATAVAARPTPAAHASDLESHKTTAPNTGNAKTDQKYQKQQNTLVAKQTQDHQKLAQQQDREHQQLAKTNASEAQKQQVEQKHQQQTQQLEQKHATQTQKVQTKQQPAKSASRPEGEKPH